jgi:MFS family permease
MPSYTAAAMTTAAAALPGAQAQSRFSTARHLGLASFWFGMNFGWLPIGYVILQSQVRSVVPAGDEGSALGSIVAVGAVFATTVPPLVGHLSDQLTTPWGRRRPVMAVGTVLSLVGLVVLFTATSFWQLLVGYAWLQIFLNGAGAAYAGVIPDVVPADEFGRSSGFLAGLNQAGGLAGVGVALATSSLFHRVTLTYLAVGVVLLLTLGPAVVASRGEGSRPVERRPPRPWREALRDFLGPLASGDFGWVIFTRAMVTAAIVIVASFLSFFFRDVVRVASPDQFTSFWLGIVFVAAVPFGISGGALSDLLGRKRFVYASGLSQSLVALVFIVFYPTQVPLVVGLGFLYGLGYGLYYAVDWALACDTLPDRDRSAKDMGLFHVAQTLPTTVVPAAGGFLLDFFNHRAPNSGYRVVFGAAIVFFALGTVFVSRIRSVR